MDRVTLRFHTILRYHPDRVEFVAGMLTRHPLPVAVPDDARDLFPWWWARPILRQNYLRYLRRRQQGPDA